jgi:hypothetical protein
VGGMNVAPLPSDQHRKGGSLVPEKSRSGAVQEFHRRKADFLATEQRWLSLARSYEAETVRAAPRRALQSEHK